MRECGKGLKADDFVFYNDNGALNEYNPLHDPHLKSFFLRKANLDHLRKNKFITENNQILCKLKDLNHHRNLVHRFNTDFLMMERKAAAINYLDEFRLKKSEELFDKMRLDEKYFMDLYGDKKPCCIDTNPVKHQNRVAIMQRRKESLHNRKMER